MEKIYFVMPAYNESENIKETVAQWYPVIEKINKMDNCEAVLAIANDGSKDDTFEVMKNIKEGGHSHFLSLLLNLMAGMELLYYIYIVMP